MPSREPHPDDDPYHAGGDFIDAGGVRLHYALSGAAGAPLLALINPASHNLTCWEPLLPELEKSFRVLRFDIRGTGRSGWGDDAAFTFRHYADDLAALLEALALPPAFVTGTAYGARTAARFALHHPERLSALGLFDVALTPPVEQTGQRELGREARRLLEAAGEPAVQLHKYWRFYEDREAARKAHTAHEHEPDLSEALADVAVPVLVACGRQDMNLAQAERIASAIPGSTFQVMEMTGHGSLFFRPDLVAELLVAFASRHDLRPLAR